MKAQIIQFQMQLNLSLIILCEFNNSYSNAHQSNNEIPMRINRLLNRDSHCKVKRKDKIQTKPLQNLVKSLQRSKTAFFHSWVDEVVRFLEDDDWR
jgi:hypothetical protein